MASGEGDSFIERSSESEATESEGDSQTEETLKPKQHLLGADQVVRPAKWIVRSVIALVIISYSAGTIGSLFFADFVSSRPALLLALSPQDRNLVLVSEKLEPLTYYSIAFVRLAITGIPYFFVGRWFSESAIKFARRNKAIDQLLAEGEESLRRASYFMVFFIAAFPSWMLSGAMLVRFRVFIAIHIVATAGRLAFYRWVGEVASSPVERVLDFISKYRFQIIGATFVWIVWTLFKEYRNSDSKLNMMARFAKSGGAKEDKIGTASQPVGSDLSIEDGLEQFSTESLGEDHQGK